MISSQVWRALRWQPTVNTDYDGAVLVGGLENELRHFGDPDEEHDFWVHPPPLLPCPYTHEGKSSIAKAEKKEKKEKKQKLRAARRSSILGISNYENDSSQESPEEAVVEGEQEKNKEGEDGCTIEGCGEPLEFYDNWFGGVPPEDNDECEIEFEDCAKCGRISEEKLTGKIQEVDNCEQNAEEKMADSMTGEGTRTAQENKDSDLDLEESFILMFNEVSEAQGGSGEAKDTASMAQRSMGRCFCRCGDSSFIKIEDSNTINGLNGISANPCPARAVIAAQPGFWRAMTACRPLERARRPHIVRPGSWQAV